MSLIAAAKTSPHSTRFAAFLGAALVLHALFLLLPARRGLEPGQVLQRLSVTLQGVAERAPEVEAGAKAGAKTGAEMAPPVSPTVRPFPSPTADEATEPLSIEPPENAGGRRANPDPGLSTARLLDDAFRMRWESPQDIEGRRLGEPVPRYPAGPGRAAGGLEQSNPPGPLRDGGVQIVDRWQSADGSHNVRVRTPSGGMLCGRAEAWNPLQPLAEPVMMWRDCGSGEATFVWPDAYRSTGPRRR